MSDAKLSIIVPVYNEAVTLPIIMQRIVDSCGDFANIIYIDDGSQDDSLTILRKYKRENDIVLTKENGGKGSAVRKAIPYTECPYTIIQDADLEYDPAEIKKLLDHAEKNPGHIVFGSRFLIKNPIIYNRFWMGNKILTTLCNLLFGVHLTDSYTCYKLFPTEILKALPLKADGFELESELCCFPLRKRIPILELPVRYAPRRIEEGKKIRLRDGLKGMLSMIRMRFASR